MRTVLFLMTLLFASSPAWAGKTILVFGDSLSAGFGLPAGAAWPNLLDARLRERRLDYSVANLSISGETTDGGLARLPEALRRHRPAVVVLELGANDGLRGLPLTRVRQNLQAMIAASKKAGARVLLVGMRLPPNYGPYAEQFNATFAELAKSEKIAFSGFFFEGFADQPEYFLPDMLHPNAKAQPRLLDNLWPALQPLLK